MRELVEKKSKESQAEIARLKEGMALDHSERDTRTKQAQEQLNKWDDIGKSLGTVMDQARQIPAAPVQADRAGG